MYTLGSVLEFSNKGTAQHFRKSSWSSTESQDCPGHVWPQTLEENLPLKKSEKIHFPVTPV